MRKSNSFVIAFDKDEEIGTDLNLVDDPYISFKMQSYALSGPVADLDDCTNNYAVAFRPNDLVNTKYELQSQLLTVEVYLGLAIFDS